MREGLEDGAGNDGYARLRVVTVVEVACYPVAKPVVEISHRVMQKVGGQLARRIPTETSRQSTVALVCGADGQ